MIKLSVSHVDHGLTESQIAYILERFAGRDAFFIETFELPVEHGKAPCLLYGPMMGDLPTPAAFEMQRGDRTWWTPVVEAPVRMTRIMTVIAGPHEEVCDPAHHWPKQCILCNGEGKIKHSCVLYTAYAGPRAPQEPDDPSCRNVPESRRFWSEHALATVNPPYKLRERKVEV